MGKHPTDRGKIGAKRSVLTEGGGVPIGLAVERANRHDVKMVRETVEALPSSGRPRPRPCPKECLDKGYDDDEVRDLLADSGSPSTSGREGKRPKRCSRTPGSGHGDGSWSARIVG